MKHHFLHIIGFLLIIGGGISCSNPPPSPDFVLKSRPVTVDGAALIHHYHWAAPRLSASPREAGFPLVVYLHGWGPSNQPADLKEGFPPAPRELLDLPASADHPAYVYVPVCPPPYKTREEPSAPEGGEWNSEAALAMVVGTIELLKQEYPIDPARIYVVGFSMGGAGTWFVGARYHQATGSRFAAVGRGSGWYLDAMAGREELHRDLSLSPVWVHAGETEGRGYDTAWDTYRYFQDHFAAGPESRSVRTVGEGLIADPQADIIEGTSVPLSADLFTLPLTTGGEMRLSVYHGRGHEDLMYRNTDFLDWLFAQQLNLSNKER